MVLWYFYGVTKNKNNNNLLNVTDRIRKGLPEFAITMPGWKGGGVEGGGFGAVSKQLGVGGNGLLQIITHQHHMSAVKSSSNFPNSQFSVQPRGAADVQATAVNEISFLLDEGSLVNPSRNTDVVLNIAKLSSQADELQFVCLSVLFCFAVP